MNNINEQTKYPVEVYGAQREGRADDYRFHYGFVRDEDWRLRMALGLPTVRRMAWQGVALALILGVLVGVLSVGSAVHRANAGELPFRLHIVANSDSAADQALKLQVRDAVVEYLTPLLEGADDVAQAEEIVLSELANLELLAAGMCADMGYGCRGEVGVFDFPAKRYGRTMLPAGEYRALRLNLGAAEGHNWWCVIFPPLCFVDECGDLAAVDAAADEELLGARRVVRLKLCEIFSEAQ